MRTEAQTSARALPAEAGQDVPEVSGSEEEAEGEGNGKAKRMESQDILPSMFPHPNFFPLCNLSGPCIRHGERRVRPSLPGCKALRAGFQAGTGVQPSPREMHKRYCLDAPMNLHKILHPKRQKLPL